MLVQQKLHRVMKYVTHVQPPLLLQQESDSNTHDDDDVCNMYDEIST